MKRNKPQTVVVEDMMLSLSDANLPRLPFPQIAAAYRDVLALKQQQQPEGGGLWKH